MESLTELTPVGFWNYAIGYLGAFLVILVMFNNWKNKLDQEDQISSFRELLPKLSKWSYDNFDDWLVMIVGTPVLIFLQTAIVYVAARYYDHELDNVEVVFYDRVHYLISFLIGVLSQTLGSFLIYLGSVVYKKLKSLFS